MVNSVLTRSWLDDRPLGQDQRLRLHTRPGSIEIVLGGGERGSASKKTHDGIANEREAQGPWCGKED